MMTPDQELFTTLREIYTQSNPMWTPTAIRVERAFARRDYRVAKEARHSPSGQIFIGSSPGIPKDSDAGKHIMSLENKLEELTEQKQAEYLKFCKVQTNLVAEVEKLTEALKAINGVK